MCTDLRSGPNEQCISLAMAFRGPVSEHVAGVAVSSQIRPRLPIVVTCFGIRRHFASREAFQGLARLRAAYTGRRVG